MLRVLCFFGALLIMQSCSDDSGPNATAGIQGKWRVSSTSGGHSNGYDPDFILLEIDAALDFVLIDLGSQIVAEGSIVELDSFWGHYNVSFVTTKVNPDVYVPFLDDVGHGMVLEDNMLDIIHYCCDGYDTQFIRVE